MWHEARKSEKKVHGMMDNAKKRAEKRAAFLSKRRGDPLQSLRLAGFSCKVYHNLAIYQSIEQQQGMIPWNGNEDNLIDRFDGRSLLDFIREYDLKQFPLRVKSEEEEELDDRVNFESYRDLVKMRRKGLTDLQGIRKIEDEIEVKSRASLNQESSENLVTKKTSYVKIGYDYGGETKVFEESEDETEEEEESEESEDEKLGEIGKGYGIEDFNRLVFLEKKAKEEEKRIKEFANKEVDPAERKLQKRERRKISRKSRDYDLNSLPSSFRERRRSPEYEPFNPSGSYRREGRRSKGKEEDERPKIEFITEFGSSEITDNGSLKTSIQKPKLESWAETSRTPIVEALRSDPALVTPQPPPIIERDRTKSVPSAKSTSESHLPKLLKDNSLPSASGKFQKPETPQERLKRIMNKQLNKQIRKDSAQENAKKMKLEEEQREKDRESHRGGRRRSRSKSRSRSRSRSRSPRYERRWRHQSRSRSRSRSPRYRR